MKKRRGKTLLDDWGKFCGQKIVRSFLELLFEFFGNGKI
jgi:hypothetical protein